MWIFSIYPHRVTHQFRATIGLPPFYPTVNSRSWISPHYVHLESGVIIGIIKRVVWGWCIRFLITHFHPISNPRFGGNLGIFGARMVDFSLRNILHTLSEKSAWCQYWLMMQILPLMKRYFYPRFQTGEVGVLRPLRKLGLTAYETVCSALETTRNWGTIEKTWAALITLG